MNITDTEFGQIFPFYFQSDEYGQITQTGPSLQRFLQRSDQGKSLFAQFTFKSPAINDLAGLDNRIENIFLIALTVEPGLVLRGQFLRLQHHGGYLFIGVPWVTDLKSLSALGLSLKDYSLYEPTTYFLLLSEAQRSSLEKSENIKGQLQELNESLAKRVERRTERLSQINDELVASQEKLRQEMRHREEVEVELRLAQKMEALGLLSAGIAHEINTPIQFIGDSLRFIQEAANDLQKASIEYSELIDTNQPEIKQKLLSINKNYDLDYLLDRLPESIDRAISGVDRVSTIVRSMKAFSHHTESVRNLANINEGIENTLVVAKNEYKMIADVETHLSELPNTHCNIGDLNQVFLNLIVNAAQAINERFLRHNLRGRGKIIISSAHVDNEIVIKVKDNGCGIPDTIKEKIFDPFFTTKSIGQGSGQGLSLCHRVVVNQHGGSIKVESEIDVGTEFSVHLPITSPEYSYEEATS